MLYRCNACTAGVLRTEEVATAMRQEIEAAKAEIDEELQVPAGRSGQHSRAVQRQYSGQVCPATSLSH